MDIFDPRQWNRNRLPVLREDFRYVSAAARPKPKRDFRHWNRLGPVQGDCGKPWRPGVGRISVGKWLDLLRSAARWGGENGLGCIGKRSAGLFRPRCPKLIDNCRVESPWICAAHECGYCP